MCKLFTGSLTVERVQVEIRNLPDRLQGLRIAQLSDFHYDGLRLSDELLAEAIATCNALNPDLIALTGDFVTDAPEWIDKLTPWLKHLRSTYGTYAVLGNHDNYYRRSRPHITQALTNIGIHVLWNQIAYPFGAELPVIGLAEFWSRDFKPSAVLNPLDPTTPRLVLSHNPDSAEHLKSWRVDLQLSGHSHGGQIVIPGIGNMSERLSTWYRQLPKGLKPFMPFLRVSHHTLWHWEWAQGLHQVGNNQLYVNRGLGSYFPGRLFCPPEVTLITLV